MEDSVYQAVLDPTMKTCIAGKAKPPSLTELLEYAPFKARWDDAITKAAEESAAAVSLATGNLDDDAGTADAVGPPTDPIASANPAGFALNSDDYWLAHASQFLRTYINLVEEVSTVPGVSAIVNQFLEKRD